MANELAREVARLMKREDALRTELRAVSEKLAAVRAALGMGHLETPDYLDSESREPYVTIVDLVVGAVNAANGPISVGDVRRSLAAVRKLSARQAAMALCDAMRLGIVRRVGRGLYAAIDQPQAAEEAPAEELVAQG